MPVKQRLLIVIPIFLLGFFGITRWQAPTLLKALPIGIVLRLPQNIVEIAYPSTLDLPTLPEDVLAGLEGGDFSAEPLVNLPVDGGETAVIQETAPQEAQEQPPVQPDPNADATPNPDTNVPILATPTNAPTPTNASTPTSIVDNFPQDDRPQVARIGGFTYEAQKPNYCGPTTLAMALSHFGMNLNQLDTGEILKPNVEDRNVSVEEMELYVQQHTNLDAISRANGDMETVKRLIAKGFPVIMEVGQKPEGDYAWYGWYSHFVLGIGFDDNLQTIYQYDTFLGTGVNQGDYSDTTGRPINYQKWDSDWQQFNRKYIVLFNPIQRDLVTSIVGDNMDDTTMWSRASEQAQRDIDANRQNAFAYLNKGEALTNLGQYESAAKHYDIARYLDSKNSDALPDLIWMYVYSIHEAYYNVGRHSDIILIANSIIEHRPFLEELFYYRGLAQKATGNVDGANSDFQYAIDFSPFSPTAEQARLELNS